MRDHRVQRYKLSSMFDGARTAKDGDKQQVLPGTPLCGRET